MNEKLNLNDFRKSAERFSDIDRAVQEWAEREMQRDAGPELYAALDVLLHVFCDLPAANNYGEVVQQARAALAKARG